MTPVPGNMSYATLIESGNGLQKLLVRIDHGTPNIIQVVATDLDCFQELEYKILLLRTGYNSYVGLGTMDLQWIWNIHLESKLLGI